MLKLFKKLFLSSSLFFFAENAGAQIVTKAMEIDSVIVIPNNPTNNDLVRIVTYSHAYHGSCFLMNSLVNGRFY